MKYIVLDTETGGLDPTCAALVSLGAVVWDSAKGRQSDLEFYAVINDTEGDLDPDAMKINGFSRDRLEAEGISPAQALSEFRTFCNITFPGRQAQLAGHNVGFDVGFLRRLFRITGNNARYEACIGHRTLCSMNAVRFLSLTGHIRPGLGGLLQCVEELGLTKQEAHNALGDARMAADLLTGLLWIGQQPPRWDTPATFAALRAA